MSNSREQLAALMKRYTVDSLKGITAEEFKEKIESMCKMRDGGMEGFTEEEEVYQRDQAIRFQWGHNHDFGTFKMQGAMQGRHVGVLAKFVDMGLNIDLSAKSVVEIGPWTGGMSLVLAAMGATVLSIEEVLKYEQCVAFLANSFGIENLYTVRGSLYDVHKMGIEKSDFVILAGVLYHVSDPVVALRRCFDLLKVGGRIFVETESSPGDGKTYKYCGPGEFTSGSREKIGRAHV